MSVSVSVLHSFSFPIQFFELVVELQRYFDKISGITGNTVLMTIELTGI